MSDRIRIWEENKDIAMLALGQLYGALEPRHDIMVVVAVQDDALGRATTKAITRAVEVRDDIDAIVIETQDGVGVMVAPIFLVKAMTKLTSPSCSDALEEPCPEGQTWILVISGGGMALLYAPVEPMRSIGNA